MLHAGSRRDRAVVEQVAGIGILFVTGSGDVTGITVIAVAIEAKLAIIKYRRRIAENIIRIALDVTFFIILRSAAGVERVLTGEKIAVVEFTVSRICRERRTAFCCCLGADICALLPFEIDI